MLKQSTDQMDTLAGDSQTSIAQMLASQSLGSFAPVSVDKYSNAFETVDDTQDKELTKAEEAENNISQSQISDSSNNKMSGDSKESSAKTVDKTPELEASESSDKESDDIAAQKSKVVEKHANVDLEEFDFVHKQAPTVDENSAEIVKFDSKDSENSQVDTRSDDIQGVTNASDSKTEAGETPEVLKNKLVENKAVEKESEQVVIPEDTSKIIKTDKKTPVPIVVVPALDEALAEKGNSKSVKQIVSTTQDTNNEILEQQIDKKEAGVLELRPQVEQSVPVVEGDGVNNFTDAVEKDAANLKAKSDKKVKDKKNRNDKLLKDERKFENDFAAETVQESKKSVFGNLFGNKQDKHVKSDSDIEKNISLKEDNIIQNEHITIEDNAESLKPQKKEKTKSKDKEKIQSSQEDLISSFVQSTFGSSDTVEAKEKEIVDSSSDDKNKKDKFKKEKNVKNTETASNENSETSKNSKKTSKKSFWARFKRSDNSEKSTKFEKENITTESGVLDNNEIHENLVDTDTPVKTKKEKIKKKEKKISSEVSSETESQDKQDSNKKNKLKNKKEVESVAETFAPDDKKVSGRKAKKAKNNDSKNENKVKEEHSAKTFKIPHILGKSKEQNNEESLQLDKPKVHVPTAKDKFEVYTKDNKQRTIIKQMSK